MNKTCKKQVIKRKFVGEVISDAMAKTVVVRVATKKMHPKYKKLYATNKKYYVHDEDGKAKKGSQVSFIECRPLSKTKRWRILEVLS